MDELVHECKECPLSAGELRRIQLDLSFNFLKYSLLHCLSLGFCLFVLVSTF